jgi:hypothetical protein
MPVRGTAQQHDVGWFQIAVHDAFGMCGLERLRHLNGNAHGLRNGQRTSPQPHRQRFAVEILHHEEVDALVMPEIVECTDVRMREPRDRPRLVRKSSAAARVGRRVRRQDLQRDVTVEPGVAGPIDFAHAAGAGEALDLEHADARPGRQNPGAR